MAAIARLSRMAAKADPSAAFERPEDIVADILLTRGEKLAALRTWRRKLVLQISGASDAMVDAMVDAMPSSAHATTLLAVDKAIEQLQVPATV